MHEKPNDILEQDSVRLVSVFICSEVITNKNVRATIFDKFWYSKLFPQLFPMFSLKLVCVCFPERES